jgi:hypothetical protein
MSGLHRSRDTVKGIRDACLGLEQQNEQDLTSNHPKSGSWVIATMGRIGAFAGHEHNSFDAFASPGR